MSDEPAVPDGGLRRALPAAIIVAGAAVLLLLHFVVPPLGATWAFAHLARRPLLPWVAAALVVLLPPLGGWLWPRPWLHAPLRPMRPVTAGLAAAAVIGAVVAAGLRWPAVPICIDSWWFAKAVGDGVTQNPRWELALWTFGRVAHWVRPWATPTTTVRVLNGLLAGTALVALAGAARRLGRSVGEAAAITALAWTAFGTLQLALGYVDVYPVELAFVALHLWAGAAALAGKRHPAWAVALAAAGPFFYVGLVLLAPSAVVLAWFGGPSAERRRRLAVCALVAVAAAGVATVPVHGVPFAWPAFVHAMATEGNPAAAFGRGGPALGVSEILTAMQLTGVLHVLVLVDGVGVLLLVACAWPAAAIAPRRLACWGAAVLAPQLAYLLVMDPLFGHFADWDLFSTLAASTSLFGGVAFVTWGRGAPRATGVLLGLALAAALVHLLARLDALDVAFAAHLAETPFRVTIPR